MRRSIVVDAKADLLVVGEFALALVLLVGAALLARSFARLLRPEGFGRVLIVGTGQQAGAHARALWATGRVDHIHLCGRDPVRTAALVQRLLQGPALAPVAAPVGLAAHLRPYGACRRTGRGTADSATDVGAAG